jgi:DNA invertase Pin-like site-specific DNA recombinase
MAEGKWISYLRVSTKRQGKSGLGLDAQRHAVTEFLNGGSWMHVKEFVEIESGKKAARPQLEEALRACRAYGAKLLIAKLDRLSRNAHFLLGLQEAGVEFVAVDMPFANRLTVGVMALMAEEEGKQISKRTRDALAAAKRRGVKLGGDRGVIPTARARKASAEALQARAAKRAADLAPIVKELQDAGVKGLNGIAAGLNEKGITTPRGRAWSATQVSRLLGLLPTS